jgi:two-component system LytT family sensor kinase
MHVLGGVLIGVVATLVVALIWRARQPAGPPDSAAEQSHGMQSALHAATATLPHLRRGLDIVSAEAALPHLRTLTGAAAIALADTTTVLAIVGEGREQVRPGDVLSRLLADAPDDRVQVVPRLISSDPDCPLHAAALAPLVVQGVRVGTLVAFYRTGGWPSGDELRVLAEAASLVCAQVELSVLAAQQSRLAQAELRALRAQISPHFIYNVLAAIAANIHQDPAAAREQLIDFADFTRYLFRDKRPYVTLAEEVAHVARYLRLEEARIPGGLEVQIELAPGTGEAIVPTMSLQPLAENAIRHGVRPGGGTIAIRALRVGSDVELSVSDDGAGFPAQDVESALRGAGGGIGLSNVDGRLRTTFGEAYALHVQTAPGEGTTVTMWVPHALAADTVGPPVGPPLGVEV